MIFSFLCNGVIFGMINSSGVLFVHIKKGYKGDDEAAATKASLVVSLGNTVVVIEHNLDVIKTADYIVDMGPEGGVKGGKIIAEGKPEEICKVNGSYTGKFLKNLGDYILHLISSSWSKMLDMSEILSKGSKR